VSAYAEGFQTSAGGPGVPSPGNGGIFNAGAAVSASTYPATRAELEIPTGVGPSTNPSPGGANNFNGVTAQQAAPGTPAATPTESNASAPNLDGLARQGVTGSTPSANGTPSRNGTIASGQQTPVAGTQSSSSADPVDDLTGAEVRAAGEDQEGGIGAIGAYIRSWWSYFTQDAAEVGDGAKVLAQHPLAGAKGAITEGVPNVAEGVKEAALEIAKADRDVAAEIVNSFRGEKTEFWSDTGTAFDEGELTLGEFYTGAAIDMATLGGRSQLLTLADYADGLIDEEEASKRLGGTAAMQLLFAKALHGTELGNTPVQELPSYVRAQLAKNLRAAAELAKDLNKDERGSINIGPRETQPPYKGSPGEEIDPTKVDVYRGGSEMKVEPTHIRIDPETGLVKSTHGLSLDTDSGALARFGATPKIKRIPPELKIIQRGGRDTHFEVVPREPMTPARYQELVDRIEFHP